MSVCHVPAEANTAARKLMILDFPKVARLSKQANRQRQRGLSTKTVNNESQMLADTTRTTITHRIKTNVFGRVLKTMTSRYSSLSIARAKYKSSYQLYPA